MEPLQVAADVNEQYFNSMVDDFVELNDQIPQFYDDVETLNWFEPAFEQANYFIFSRLTKSRYEDKINSAYSEINIDNLVDTIVDIAISQIKYTERSLMSEIDQFDVLVDASFTRFWKHIATEYDKISPKFTTYPDFVQGHLTNLGISDTNQVVEQYEKKLYNHTVRKLNFIRRFKTSFRKFVNKYEAHVTESTVQMRQAFNAFPDENRKDQAISIFTFDQAHHDALRHLFEWYDLEDQNQDVVRYREITERYSKNKRSFQQLDRLYNIREAISDINQLFDLESPRLHAISQQEINNLHQQITEQQNKINQFENQFVIEESELDNLVTSIWNNIQGSLQSTQSKLQKYHEKYRGLGNMIDTITSTYDLAELSLKQFPAPPTVEDVNEYILNQIGIDDHETYQMQIRKQVTDYLSDHTFGWWLWLSVFEQKSSSINYYLYCYLASFIMTQEEDTPVVVETLVDKAMSHYVAEDLIPYAQFVQMQIDETIDIEQIAKLVMRNDYENTEFVVSILLEYYNSLDESDLKHSLMVLKRLEPLNTDTSLMFNIAVKLIDYYIGLGRFDEALEKIEEIEDQAQTIEQANLLKRFKFVIFHNQGHVDSSFAILNSLSDQDPDNAKRYHDYRIKLNIKYQNWDKILDLQADTELIENAKLIATHQLEWRDPRYLEELREEIKAKFDMILYLLENEQQELVPNFAKHIQDRIYDLGEEHLTEEFWNYLGFSYYYEGISYELLLDEIEKLNDCYEIAAKIFKRANNPTAAVEVAMKLLELRQFNLLKLQAKYANNVEQHTQNPLELLINQVKVQHYKQQTVVPIMRQIDQLLPHIEDDKIINSYQEVETDFDNWCDSINKKFQIYLFASQIDRYMLIELLKHKKYEITDKVLNEIDITLSIIRRLRPGKGQHFFNFRNIISELSRTRLTNTFMDRINHKPTLAKYYTIRSATFSQFSSLSYIELTSLMIILALPYLEDTRTAREKIALDYDQRLETVLQDQTFSGLVDIAEKLTDSLLMCLIHASPVLLAFGGLNND